jgi:uncharacterized membrane protein
MLWSYISNGQQIGPVEEDEFFQLARLGKIKPTDLVWNPTLGDKWVEAGTIEGLVFDAPPEPSHLPPSEIRPQKSRGTGGQTENYILMQQARDCLNGRWGLSIGVTLLYLLLSMVSSSIPMIGGIASLIIEGPLLVGLSIFFISISRKEKAELSQLFDGFKRFGTSLAAYLLVAIFTFLWSLLLIIPGIIASYSYAMTYFIIVDNPNIGPLEAITKSKTLMRGNRLKLFCLGWRFFGWALLCMLTCGIGFLWLVPYVHTSFARFYEDIK